MKPDHLALLLILIATGNPFGKAACQEHEYIRNGTAKLLTLFHPATGQVRVKGVTSCTNAVLHHWLTEELAPVVQSLPTPARLLKPEENQRLWKSWQQGLKVRFTLPQDLPPLRMLLVMDNLAGHKTPLFVLWLCAHGIMPLYTPVGGSWLNMTESTRANSQAPSCRGTSSTNSCSNY